MKAHTAVNNELFAVVQRALALIEQPVIFWA